MTHLVPAMRGYSASFTAGGILYREFEALLPLIKQEDNNLLREESRDNAFMMVGTEAARKRIMQEVRKRIAFTDPDFWSHYSSSDEADRRLMLFLLCLQAYQLVWDFHFSVTRQRYWSGARQLDIKDFEIYLDELSARDNDVSTWTDNTKTKCITNYLRMLKEAGFLVSERIHQPFCTEQLSRFFASHQESWMLDAFFPSAQEKKRLLKNYQ